MNEKLKKIGILILMIVLVGLVISWFTVFNKGDIAIETGLENYSITIGENTTTCPNDPCIINITSGVYQLIFEKEGYNSNTVSVTAKRGKETPAVLSPTKVIKLEESVGYQNEISRPSIQAPFNVEADNIIASVWNADNSKFLYLDGSDNRLKITNKTGEGKLITSLKNITPPLNLYWAPDENKILGNQNKDLYFIEVEAGSRKKNVIDFKLSNITWSPTSDYILFNSGESLYKLDWNSFYETIKLDTFVDLSKSLWINESTLLTYTTDEEISKTIVWSYNPSNGVQETITQRFNFPIKEMKFDSGLNIVYVYNLLEEKWYEITL